MTEGEEKRLRGIEEAAQGLVTAWYDKNATWLPFVALKKALAPVEPEALTKIELEWLACTPRITDVEKKAAARLRFLEAREPR